MPSYEADDFRRFSISSDGPRCSAPFCVPCPAPTAGRDASRATAGQPGASGSRQKRARHSTLCTRRFLLLPTRGLSNPTAGYPSTPRPLTPPTCPYTHRLAAAPGLPVGPAPSLATATVACFGASASTHFPPAREATSRKPRQLFTSAAKHLVAANALPQCRVCGVVVDGGSDLPAEAARDGATGLSYSAGSRRGPLSAPTFPAETATATPPPQSWGRGGRVTTPPRRYAGAARVRVQRYMCAGGPPGGAGGKKVCRRRVKWDANPPTRAVSCAKIHGRPLHSVLGLGRVGNRACRP